MLTTNLFDFFEDAPPSGEGRTLWTARAPLRPQERFDLMLVPRAKAWETDAAALAALERIEAEPWVGALPREDGGVRLRLADDWIEQAGARIEGGDDGAAGLADLATGRSYVVQFWDANATKALHAGHLRNLALGNALAAALEQAGARVERRSTIADAGRSMGEAMAGVMKSGRHAQWLPAGDEKSDHFVGRCYADYVAAGETFGGERVQQPEDSMTRELTVRGDAADDLLDRVLQGERQALELWSKTRAWVIAGQRKTLARLGIAFDRVFFESDFIGEAAALIARGLNEGRLVRRGDGVVVYATGRKDFDELPLVRADGAPTQHLRSVAYWMTEAPGLARTTSVQVCGEEWVPHAHCIAQLMHELTPEGNGGVHPTRDIFHGMVTKQEETIASSNEGALLIDELADWLDEQIDADARGREVREGHPTPDSVAAQIALGYFLPRPVSSRIDLTPAKLLVERESPGWELALARSRGPRVAAHGSPAADPDYRFAVVQSQMHRRHLRLVAERLDVNPLARYATHLARWHLEQDRDERVTRVTHALLDRGARGLGLAAAS